MPEKGSRTASGAPCSTGADACNISGKVCYGSAAAARSARKHVPSNNRTLDVYFCDHCRHFHLGSPRRRS